MANQQQREAAMNVALQTTQYGGAVHCTETLIESCNLISDYLFGKSDSTSDEDEKQALQDYKKTGHQL